MSSWSERAYADAHAYLAHRAQVITELGPRLVAGDSLLDLACGDAGLADFLQHGVRYFGVDASSEMVAAARGRGHDAVVADLNDFVPQGPVDVTSCFRAIYYARDRKRFFTHVGAYTHKKLVFDINPRQYELRAVLGDLRETGWKNVELQPFFAPQRVALPRPLLTALETLERVDVVARFLLRFRFTYVCAASR